MEEENKEKIRIYQKDDTLRIEQTLGFKGEVALQEKIQKQKEKKMMEEYMELRRKKAEMGEQLKELMYHGD